MEQQPKPIIIAHRGASFYFPENTLGAFEAALDMRAEMVELDVRRTGDGVLVVRHDADVAGRRLSDMDLAEARDLAEEGGFPLATLREALEVLSGRIQVDVEIKEPGCEADVVRQCLDVLPIQDLTLSSFSDGTVATVGVIDPRIRAGLILGWRRHPSVLRDLFPASRVRACGARVVMADRRLLRWGLAGRVRSLGLPLWVYTVNDRKELWSLISGEEVDGVFTDRPDVALFLRDMWRVSGDAERAKY